MNREAAVLMTDWQLIYSLQPGCSRRLVRFSVLPLRSTGVPRALCEKRALDCIRHMRRCTEQLLLKPLGICFLCPFWKAKPVHNCTASADSFCNGTKRVCCRPGRVLLQHPSSCVPDFITCGESVGFRFQAITCSSVCSTTPVSVVPGPVTTKSTTCQVNHYALS